MPPFPRPRFEYRYRLTTELRALREHARSRGVPRRRRNRLLLATWNIANLGTQDRSANDYALLAEILSWFDVVAVQEVNDDLSGMRSLQAALPDRYRVLFSDASGNQERGAFVYDAEKVELLEKVGRLSIPPSQLRRIKLPGRKRAFGGFDRGPYMAAFQARSFRFLLVNVHLFFGSKQAVDLERRSHEAYAVAYWADKRRTDPHAFTTDIIALGDFNLPKVHPEDPVFKALTARGLVLRRPELRERLSAVGGSSLAGHHYYDQVAFFPSETTELMATDVFDLDNALFRGLWRNPKRTNGQFLAYTRYHVSDHRPLWAEIALT